MAPITKLALLVAFLASEALAAPQGSSYKHAHLHHKHATGTGTGYPSASGAPYGQHNHTHYGTGTAWGTGYKSGYLPSGHHHHSHTGTAPIAYTTLTVLPIPASSSDAAAASSAVTSAPPAYTDITYDDGTGASEEPCSETTVYVTDANTVTVYVTEDEAAATSTAAASAYTSAAASSSNAPYAMGNSSVWDGPTGFPHYGTGATGAVSSTMVKFTSPMVSPQPYTTLPAAASSSTTAAASSSAAAVASSSSTSTTAPVAPPPYAAPPPPASTTSTTSTTPASSTAAAVPATTSTTAALVGEAAAPVKSTPKPTTLITSTTVAATSKSTTSSATPTATPPATPASGGSGRGLVYNTASLCAAFESSTAISWAYNWGSSSGGLSSSLEYVPMIWGMNGAQDNFLSNAEAAIASGSKHVMGFNEPDLSSQSNLDPGAAASAYQTYMMPLQGKALLGAPAVTNANQTSPPMGVQWLKAFESDCGSACHVDFVPMHWYGWDNPPATAAQQAQAFQDYFTIASQEVRALWGPETMIWVTEFSALPLDDQELNAEFLQTVLAWLDGDGKGIVERYSFFMVSGGSLVNSDGSLTQSGSAYLDD